MAVTSAKHPAYTAICIMFFTKRYDKNPSLREETLIAHGVFMLWVDPAKSHEVNMPKDGTSMAHIQHADRNQ